MNHRVLVSVSVVGFLVVFASLGTVPAAAQTAVPRTAWGHPDLQGIWDFSTITPLERPEELADKEFWTAAEAANIEQEVVDRDSRLLATPRERRPSPKLTFGQMAHRASITIFGWTPDQNLSAPGERRRSWIP